MQEQKGPPLSAPLFAIRPAEDRDLVYLRMICEESGLGFVETVVDSFVAVNGEDVPVGFIHIETVTDDMNPAANGAYVYPVAVYEAWQRNGVARALTQHALEATGELRLVACKPSRGFYPRAGFEVVDWDLIAARIAYDCDRCVARQACNPVPFRRRHQACQGDACQGDACQGDVSLDTQRRVK